MTRATSVSIQMDEKLKKEGREDFYSDYNQEVLRKSISQLDAGKGIANQLIQKEYKIKE